MLTWFRFLIGLFTFGYVVVYALKSLRGDSESENSALSSRDPEEFRKDYGDTPPY